MPTIGSAPALPVIMQAAAGECGLACFAMIAAYHGRWAELATLRRTYPLSARGASLRSIVRVCEANGMASRAVRLELEDLDKLATPCILHWDLSHFVVLKSIQRGLCVIHDPSAGVCKLPVQEVSRHFTGVALEMWPATSFEQAERPPRLRITDLWSTSRGLGRSLAEILALSALLLATTLLAPLYLQLAIDGTAIGDDALLATLASVFALILALGVAAQALRSWAIIYIGSLTSFQALGNVFRHLLRLPLPFFEGRHVGDLMSRLASTHHVRDAMVTGIAVALIDGTLSLVTGIILLSYSPRLAGIVFLSVVLYALAVTFVVPRLRTAQEEELAARAREQSFVIETLENVRMLRLFGAEHTRDAGWKNVYAAALNKSIAAGQLQIALSAARELIFGIQLIAVVYLGVGNVAAGSFSVGALVAFMAYRTTFSDRIASFAEQMMQFRILQLHLDRLSEVVRSAPESQSPSAEAPLTPPAIEVDGLRFRYSDSEPWVLDRISLRIEPGEYVGIKGASGAGKTTLLKLLLGLYIPTEGQIKIDGRPLDARLHEWREMTSVVMQDDALLAGTVADNIAVFDPNADMAKVEAAARSAFIHDDIAATPLGYLSLVGEMGLAFSAGQKQRILLARAFYKNPHVIILDEGTANLDTFAELRVADALDQMSATRVVISHRPELLQRATRVLIVEGGQVTEEKRDPGGSFRATRASGRQAGGHRF